MKTLDHYDFSGKKALMRVDFNVPLDKDFTVTDDTRIRAALPSINKILDDGGSVILMSHLGRPKDGPSEKYSLKHLLPYLQDALKRDIQFAANCVGEEAEQKAQALKPGDVLLLENLRFHKEETEGDKSFAKALARLGDVWVMDAFGTAHREHASTAVVGQYLDDRVAGYVMQAELDNAKKVLEEADRPFTAIMGGAKISDKIEVIEKLLKNIDHLIIGGGMAYTFFKAMGGQVGNSLVEEDKLDLAKKLIKAAKDQNVELHLPIDSVIADKFSAEADTQITNNHAIPAGWMGLDIGPEARQIFTGIIGKSKTILWNGPMGVFEMDKFADGTRAVAKAVVRATREGAFSLIGGGDSAAAVNQLGFGDDVSYVSTGGGALLEYFEGKELPGVKALEKKGLFS